MEYLMLAGGQFSKSRKHAVWLPSFLERYDPDTLRYYLSINMPENHDTDFNWPDFVERVNSELIAAHTEILSIVFSRWERDCLVRAVRLPSRPTTVMRASTTISDTSSKRLRTSQPPSSATATRKHSEVS